MLKVSFIKPEMDVFPGLVTSNVSPVGVDRMPIATIVVHHKAVSLALLYGEKRIGIGPGFSIDGPTVIATAPAGDFMPCWTLVTASHDFLWPSGGTSY